MSTIPAPFLTHFQGRDWTIAWAMEVIRADGEAFRWCSLTEDMTIDGDVYEASPGFDISSWVNSAGLAVDNAELTALEFDAFLRTDVLAGRWDGAQWRVLRFNWADPTQFFVYKRGTFGMVKPRRGAFVAELRDLRQQLQADTTRVFQPTCSYELGDSRCTVTLSDFTVTGSVTSVTSNRVFTDTSRTEADDYFGEGLLTWTSGDNAGITEKVFTYAADVFTLSKAMIYPIQIGDDYIVVAGCRKRSQEDCKTKFDNIINFGGEPDKPTVGEIIGPATYDA